jgi:hypothetical protein
VKATTPFWVHLNRAPQAINDPSRGGFGPRPNYAPVGLTIDGQQLVHRCGAASRGLPHRQRGFKTSRFSPAPLSSTVLATFDPAKFGGPATPGPRRAMTVAVWQLDSRLKMGAF